MIGWFRKNFSSLLWALLLSVAVWIAAVTAADPDDQRVYPKPVPIEIVFVITLFGTSITET